jgi:hypothetical protein
MNGAFGEYHWWICFLAYFVHHALQASDDEATVGPVGTATLSNDSLYVAFWVLTSFSRSDEPI